jgi:hypothetical protein
VCTQTGYTRIVWGRWGMRTLASLAFVVVAGPVAARAQSLGDLKPGARVRVEVKGFATSGLTLNVSRLTSDTLFVTDRTGSPLAFPVTDLTKVEISRGMSHVKGALIGAGVGGAAGIMVGLIAAGMPSGFPAADHGTDPNSGKHFVQGFAATMAVGAVIGGLFGSERWQRIQLRGLTIAIGR